MDRGLTGGDLVTQRGPTDDVLLMHRGLTDDEQVRVECHGDVQSSH